MKNWIRVVKKVRDIILQYPPKSTLNQAVGITNFIRENFKPKKNTKVFNED